MKRIEWAVREAQGRKPKNIVKFDCPYDYECGPLMEIETAVGDNHVGTGCRGLTCQECWDKEM